jgi:hypothetical protein
MYKTQLDAIFFIVHITIDDREWTEDGELWVQYVSSRKASRADVIQLQVVYFRHPF